MSQKKLEMIFVAEWASEWRDNILSCCSRLAAVYHNVTEHKEITDAGFKHLYVHIISVFRSVTSCMNKIGLDCVSIELVVNKKLGNRLVSHRPLASLTHTRIHMRVWLVRSCRTRRL